MQLLTMRLVSSAQNATAAGTLGMGHGVREMGFTLILPGRSVQCFDVVYRLRGEQRGDQSLCGQRGPDDHHVKGKGAVTHTAHLAGHA